MITRRVGVTVLAAVATISAACASGDDALDLEPPSSTSPATTSDVQPSTPSTVPVTPASTTPTPVAEGSVVIDVASAGDEISPLILGISPVGITPDDYVTAGLRFISWGGNPASRYNYEIGNAWNHGADYEFRNTNYGATTGNAIRDFLDDGAAVGVESRVVVPTLGWVARNDDDATCSFPDGDRCRPASEVGNCREPSTVADPRVANVPSTPEQVASWIEGLLADGHDIRFIAMDNEPELWGDTHFDVHPMCPTYEEILDKYLTYAAAIRAVAPDAELSGPVMCCWYDYWGIAPGPQGEGPHDFLQWFLESVKAHDDRTGIRTLDVVDVHFYPQTGVFNDDIDDETSAKRLRSTRALWDPGYVDESWIDRPIEFIPRLKRTIDAAYPGTPLMISEWNFGAEETLNGALAIAETLAIYGREGVYAAAYWNTPEVGSPGFWAFAMHGNYDGAGSRFGGRIVPVRVADDSMLSSFAAIDDADGKLRVMLINKNPDEPATITLDIAGFEPSNAARVFTLGPDDERAIIGTTHDPATPLTVAPTSITVVELEPAQ
jgi:hypothetical protein